jgi:hypothetical protein
VFVCNSELHGRLPDSGFRNGAPERARRWVLASRSGDFPEFVDLSAEFDGHGSRELRGTLQTIDLAEIRGVYHRRPSSSVRSLD